MRYVKTPLLARYLLCAWQWVLYIHTVVRYTIMTSITLQAALKWHSTMTSNVNTYHSQPSLQMVMTLWQLFRVRKFDCWWYNGPKKQLSCAFQHSNSIMVLYPDVWMAGMSFIFYNFSDESFTSLSTHISWYFYWILSQGFTHFLREFFYFPFHFFITRIGPAWTSINNTLDTIEL